MKRKILVLTLIIIILCAFSATLASAWTWTKTCTSSDSVAYNKTDGSTYVANTYYDYGSRVPFDNATVKGTAGAKAFKARRVLVKITSLDGIEDEAMQEKASFHMSTGLQSISEDNGLEDYDHGTGYAKVYVYDGYCFQSGHTIYYNIDEYKTHMLTVTE